MDRRIGTRHRVSGIIVKWRRTKGRGRRHAHDALIIELSASGALVVASIDVKPVVGELAELRADHCQAIARVERVINSTDPRVLYCGVEFVALDNDFQQLVDQATADGAATHIDWR